MDLESRSGITVVIPTIPSRKKMVQKAVASALNQIVSPDAIVVSVDTEGMGAWHNRNKGLSMVETEWTAFLDDDDWLFPNHLQVLSRRAEETGADLVYPWFTGPNASKTLYMGDEEPFGREPKVELLWSCNWIPVTYLVRTEAARAIGGFPELESERWPHDNCEDWGFLRDFVDAGYTIAHAAKKTWHYNTHGRNTSGKPYKLKEVI